MLRTTLVVAMSMMLAACGNEGTTTQPSEPDDVPEGFRLQALDRHFASGTYRVAEVALRFEVVVNDDLETVRFFDLDGAEIFRSELLGKPQELAEQRRDDGKWTMTHYGVLADMNKPMEDQPEVGQWIASQEAQLVATMWREIAESHDIESGPLNGLFRYGVHLDEAMAFDQEGLEDVQEANCACYGKCGPGCFSVGSNWYCSKHDCCCRTYGNWACYSWCFAYPKCPVSPC